MSDGNSKSKKIEDMYIKLSQREHCLQRPDTYVGSINEVEERIFVVQDPNDLKNISIKKETVKFSPAFLKIFDEIITNASDHFIRTGKVKHIKVEVKDNYISVENDGPGIPVKMHEKEGIYVPELIFFNLLAGSNFDDNEQRFVGGRNGLGSKLSCIFSKKFIVETADGENSYIQVVENNLSIINPPKIKKSKDSYTKITFYPDFERFGMVGFTADIMKILVKRTLDIAAYCPKAKVYFNDTILPIKSLKDYMAMHLSPDSELFYERLDNEWEIGVAKSLSESFEQVSIVNGITTYRGGTHVNYVSLDLSKDLQELITKGNKKINISWVDVKNKLFLFLVCRVANPTFDTQTKENLTNQIKFGKDTKISESTLKKIMKSEIVQSIMDFIEAKQMQELKKLNKSLQKTKVEKLIDAKGKKREECILGLFEGDSATSFVRKFRDPNIFGAFPLRGKFLNVSELTNSTVIQNAEVQNLISSIGLHLGDKADINNMRYGKIYFFTDADFDGDSISGLLINFFYKYWKELFEEGRVYKVLTPLLVATKNKSKEYFYTQAEFDQWSKINNVEQWDIEYKKGLAALTDDEAKMILRDPNLVQLTSDYMATINLDVWFGKDSGKRKDELMK